MPGTMSQFLLRAQRPARRVFASGGLMVACVLLPLTLVRAQERLEICMDCCHDKLVECTGTTECNARYQTCVDSCRSDGTKPASWSCWNHRGPRPVPMPSPERAKPK